LGLLTSSPGRLKRTECQTVQDVRVVGKRRNNNLCPRKKKKKKKKKEPKQVSINARPLYKEPFRGKSRRGGGRGHWVYIAHTHSGKSARPKGSSWGKAGENPGRDLKSVQVAVLGEI